MYRLVKDGRAGFGYIPSRYLELLKQCVLEEPYLDNEVRLIYLRCIEGHETFDRAVLIDIERGRPEIYQAYLATRSDGRDIWSWPASKSHKKSHGSSCPKKLNCRTCTRPPRPGYAGASTPIARRDESTRDFEFSHAMSDRIQL